MTISDMPERERPLSEQFRLAAKEWVEADRVANLLEETKSANLSQMMMKHEALPVSRAEMIVKASDEWKEFLETMVQRRAEANLARVKMQWINMRFSEWQSVNANMRDERRLSR